VSNDKNITLLEKTSQKMAETASQVISMYEEYLMEKATWRDLAKNMTKLRASISAYYAAGGK
jgi:hypothetical protein